MMSFHLVGSIVHDIAAGSFRLYCGHCIPYDEHWLQFLVEPPVSLFNIPTAVLVPPLLANL